MRGIHPGITNTGTSPPKRRPFQSSVGRSSSQSDRWYVSTGPCLNNTRRIPSSTHPMSSGSAHTAEKDISPTLIPMIHRLDCGSVNRRHEMKWPLCAGETTNPRPTSASSLLATRGGRLVAEAQRSLELGFPKPWENCDGFFQGLETVKELCSGGLWSPLQQEETT